MKNVIDLVHLKTRIDRDTVSKVITETLNQTKAALLEGNEVYWPGLCKFEWKTTKRKTGATKRPKVVPEEVTTDGYVSAKGFDDIALELDI